MNAPYPPRVTLCEHRSERVSVFIDVSIAGDGDLVLSGQDVGQIPLEHWGDSDYEYWVFVAREHKERLMQLLAREVYEIDIRAPALWERLLLGKEDDFTGDPAGALAFRRLLDAHGLPRDPSAWTDPRRDYVLLLLMQQAFGDDMSASSHFMAFLKQHDVPYRFDSWV